MRKKLVPIKTLQNRARELWKKICLKRDGRICQVSKHFPQIKVRHTNVFQVDHCFSRSNHDLHLDVSNGTVICSTCNMLKKFQQYGVHIAVHEIVKKREGIDIYNRMFEQDMLRRPNLGWGKRGWLEDQIKILTEMLNDGSQRS